MDDKLLKAWRVAGIKLVGGLLILGGFLGVRMVTADPDGLDAEIAKLDAVEQEIAADAEERGVSVPPAPEDDSIVSRMKAQVMPSDGPSGPDPDRLVTCRLSGGTQFMRAADCLSRGGSSSDFEPRN